jgi:CRISPR-associated endoribonuclease Cas6
MFEYYKITVSYDVIKPIVYHDYFGLSIRGAFGFALRSVSKCKFSRCVNCPNRKTCAYFHVFSPGRINVLKNTLRRTPALFSIRDWKVEHNTFSFTIYLVKTPFLPEVLDALRRIQRIGGMMKRLGEIKFRDVSIKEMELLPFKYPKNFTIHTKTPLILLKQQTFLKQPHLNDVLDSAARRMLLMTGHDLRYNYLSATLVNTHFELKCFNRWSERRGKEEICGVMGKWQVSGAQYDENVGYLLSFATLFGVGKRTPAGFGELFYETQKDE